MLICFITIKIEEEFMIRAKFVCTWNDPYSNEETELRFTAVIDNSEENKKFFRYTPAGDINMVVRTEVADNFIVGREYYLDFTPTK